MKSVTNTYKTNISTLGRQLDSKITYTINGTQTELGKANLNSVTPHYTGNILKSVMKQLDLDSNVEIPVGTIINYQFGVKVNGGYEYIDFGNYIVNKVEEQKDKRSYLITCYDKMLYSMVDYEDLGITYPITIRNYINAICTKLGLTFANASDTFANYDKQIDHELFLDAEGYSLEYTFRDVLDQLAQVTASTICINDNDELEIRYISSNSVATIDQNYLDNVNIEMGEVYGPINSIVLSRAAESDNVYLQDDESIALNGLCELKIIDNQIMNFQDRSDYLEDILEQLDGLTYYTNDYKTKGITYLELCDKYQLSALNNTYTCIMLNDEINVTQGLKEQIHTDMPNETITDYKKADKTDRRINQAYIIVDKQNDKIEAQAETINIIATHIDRETGDVREVTTTTGFTFNADGLNIYKNDTTYNTQIDNTGTFYKDGTTVLSQTTKDGTKTKDLDIFGYNRYGEDNITDTPMFIAVKYTNANNEEGYGHFYNG